MLRIRGHLYLGRQYEHAKMKGELMDDEFDDDDYDYDDEMADDGPLHIDDEDSRAAQAQQEMAAANYPAGAAGANSSLLEKILTCPKVAARCSGGTVQEVGRVHDDDDGDEMPLTPPPSISGESLARSTPPEPAYHHHHHHHPAATAVADWEQREALDLTKEHDEGNKKYLVATPKSSPVILEPVTPPWKSGAASCVSGASSMRSSPVILTSEHHFYSQGGHHEQQPEDLKQQQALYQQQDVDLDYDERVAVNALLSLSKAAAAARG